MKGLEDLKTNKLPENTGLGHSKLSNSEKGPFMKSRDKTSVYKHLIPWIVAAAILLFLFWRIDMHQFLNALYQANLYLYMPWLIIFILAGFLLDAQNLSAVLHHFKYEISFREMLDIRGVTYLLMVVNWSLSMGGIAYYLMRDHGIPLMRGTSLMFFYNFLTQISLCIMVGFGFLLADESSELLGKMFILCVAVIIVYAIAITVLKVLPSWGILFKIKNMALLKVYHEASLKGYFVLTFWRSIYYSIFIAFFYIAVRSFHMDIPLLTLLVYVPIVLLIISLPITPFGLGTSQAAMLVFFKDFGSEANILGFGITYSTSVLLFRGIIGMFYFKKIVGLVPEKISDLKGEFS